MDKDNSLQSESSFKNHENVTLVGYENELIHSKDEKSVASNFAQLYPEDHLSDPSVPVPVQGQGKGKTNHFGLNTVIGSLNRGNIQIRSSIPIPMKAVSPWQNTIEADTNIKLSDTGCY